MGVKTIELIAPQTTTLRYQVECDGTCGARVFDIGDHRTWDTPEEAIEAALAFDWQAFDDNTTILCADCTQARTAS